MNTTTDVNEGSAALHCSTDDLPDAIKQLVGRCEINENTFDNDDMSIALVFGETLWSRLLKVADQHERLAGEARGNDRVIYSHVAGMVRTIISDMQNAGTSP